MLLAPLVLGLVLGIRHAADADHVATIASVVAGGTRVPAALRVALYWGLGHTLTFFAVGLGVVLLKLQIPPRLEQGVAIAIAISLLALGGIQIVNGMRDRSSERPIHPSRPLALGSLHGLAGSAGVALLALTTIPSQLTAVVYLFLFGVGTITGMLLITALLAWSFRLSHSITWMRRSVLFGTGVISCACGVSVLVAAFSE